MATFKCENCNNPIPPPDEVCASCGYNRQGAFVGIAKGVLKGKVLDTATFKCENCNNPLSPSNEVCTNCGYNRQGTYVGVAGSIVLPPLIPPSPGLPPIRELPPPVADAAAESMKDGPLKQGSSVVTKLGQLSLVVLLVVFGIVALIVAIYVAGAFLAFAVPIAILVNLFGFRDRVATIQGLGWAKTHRVWFSLVAFLVIVVGWSELTGSAKTTPPPQSAPTAAAVVSPPVVNTTLSVVTPVPQATAVPPTGGLSTAIISLSPTVSFDMTPTSSAPTVLPSPAVLAPTPTPFPLTATPVVPSPTQALDLLPVHKIGDDVKAQNQTVKVLSVRSTSPLEIDVVVANDASASSSVWAYYGCFYVRDSQGNDLEGTFPEGAAGWLDGKILPGDKLKGVLAFTSLGTIRGLKLYYSSCLTGVDQPTVVIGLDSDALKSPWIKPAGIVAPKPFVSGSTFRVGDTVTLNGLVVKLLDGTFRGNTFSGTVLLYNGTQSDVKLRIVDAFEIKDSDGNQARFDTHHYIVTGSIVSGDALRVPLSYVFATTTGKGVQLYFRSDLIGDNAVRYIIN